jgi:phosphoglucomutase
MPGKSTSPIRKQSANDRLRSLYRWKFKMSPHPLAGKTAPETSLVNVPKLITDYFVRKPDAAVASERVAFGTSGHRGTSLESSFNENHILAVAQAVCDVRARNGITGPLFIAIDTHALSAPALATSLEVFAANEVTVLIDEAGGYTPTPVLSHAIISHNKGRTTGLADGIVITPSHNPPRDGGYKYNPPHGGPADTDLTTEIENLANAHLAEQCSRVRRVTYLKALSASTTGKFDFVTPYVNALEQIIDFDRLRGSKLSLGADPMGGASVSYFDRIAEKYRLNLEVVNRSVDPTFRFMTLDHDGKIRMDCSSPWAMARLIELRERFDVAFGNDADSDRHGIVARSTGLMNPNHYLAVAIDYLFRTRKGWRTDAAVGKTAVSSSLIDRVAASLERPLVEVPVGFKWFVQGLSSGQLGFAGEESAGASFVRKDGTVWTTDKDGLLLDLLAAEITAATGKDPGEHYRDLVARHGEPVYARIDEPATPAQKAVLKGLSAQNIGARQLAGDDITSVSNRATGNGASLGGIKVSTAQGWFAARPSGTENAYKIYAESFRGAEHLARLQEEARAVVNSALTAAGA